MIVNTNKENKTVAQKDTEAKEEIDKLQFLYDQFGKEKIDKYRKDYAPRKVHILQVEDKVALLAPVSAEVIGEYSMLVASADIVKASQYLLENLWLDGDDEILNDEEYFISAMMQTQRLIEVKKSILTTL